MKFGMGFPAYLGALVIIGPPSAVTGLVTALTRPYFEGWALFGVAALTFVLAAILWIAAIYYIEEWRDRNRTDIVFPPHDSTTDKQD